MRPTKEEHVDVFTQAKSLLSSTPEECISLAKQLLLEPKLPTPLLIETNMLLCTVIKDWLEREVRGVLLRNSFTD